MRSQIDLTNRFIPSDIQYVAGVDLAYWKEGDKEYGVACIVVIDRKTMEVLEEVSYSDEIHVPYLPSYLAFRELPLILEAVKLLGVIPDLYMFDGNGCLHPRNMGIATHASFYLNKPTIGVAKNYYHIDGAQYTVPENRGGAYTNIVKDGEIYGQVLRTHQDVKPIYISCGNWIDLETTREFVLEFVTKDSRLPITTRFADIMTHRERNKRKNDQKR